MEEKLNFDEVIEELDRIGSIHKVAMYEKMRTINNKFMKGMKKKKLLDHMEGKVFDSSYCIMVPRIQFYAKRFLNKQRALRA